MKQRIAIAGAGPVGLTAALCLARAGHEVRVFEKEAALPTAPRAFALHPPTLDLLDRLGVLADLEPLGRRIDKIDYYRCNTGHPELVARFGFDLLTGLTGHPYRMHLEQSLLTPALLKALNREPGARVEFGAEVAGFTEIAEGIEISVRRAGVTQGETFSYLLGADGAKSTVRTAARLAFDGEDHERRLLRIMTPLDLRHTIPDLAGVSYLYNDVDSISLLEMRNLWRVIIRIPPKTSDEEARAPAFLRHELRRFFPFEGDLSASAIDIYGTSQRVAETMWRGRVLLVGDAAHLTSTRGDMNMNCGLHDAWTLGEAFAAKSLLAGLDTWTSSRRAAIVDNFIPLAERANRGGAMFLASIEASARKSAEARRFVREAAMIDIAPSFFARKRA